MRVTLVTAATFVALALRFGIGPQLPAFWYFAAVGVPLAFIDAREQRLPGLLALPSYPAALLLLGIAAMIMPGGGGEIAGLEVGIAAGQKQPAMDQLAARHRVTHPGMPDFRPAAGRSSGGDGEP